MRKLLKANFSRLWRDKVFLISNVLMVILGIALPLIHDIDNKNNSIGWTWDFNLFSYMMFAPILLSVVSAFFIGSEYSNGTMRNKLIAGHHRSHIYLANLIVSIVAGVILSAAYLIPYTCVGVPLLGVGKIDFLKIFLYLGLNMALAVAFSSVFTLIAMLCQNKAYTVAGCILLTFVLLFMGIRIISALNEQEYYAAYSYTENGVTTQEEESKNPNYLSGTKRKVYEFLYEFTSGGQVFQSANMEAEHPAHLALYDGLILVASTVGGVMIFRRKDLK